MEETSTMDSSVLIIILSVIFVLTLISIIFALLNQKSFRIKNIPIEFEDFLNQLSIASTKSNKDTEKTVKLFVQELAKYEAQNTKTKEGLNNFVQHIMSEMEAMKEHIASIQELSLQKEEKIRRYEDGYDQKQFKNFTKGLFRIIESIQEEKLESNCSSLSEIEEDILILLENNGIEKVEIEAGSSFKEYSKVAKITTTVETSDDTLDSTIKEVKKNGYIIQVDENTTKVVRPAEVVIYKLNTGN